MLVSDNWKTLPLSAQVYVKIQSDDPLYPPYKELFPYCSIMLAHVTYSTHKELYKNKLNSEKK
jgi:hypothetical protein